MSNLITEIEVTNIVYEYKDTKYVSRYHAKLAVINDLLPRYQEDITEWLADPTNLQKLIDLG